MLTRTAFSERLPGRQSPPAPRTRRARSRPGAEQRPHAAGGRRRARRARRSRTPRRARRPSASCSSRRRRTRSRRPCPRRGSCASSPKSESTLTSGTSAEPGQQPVRQLPLAGDQSVEAGLGQRPAGGGDGVRADHVRRARLVPGGPAAATPRPRRRPRAGRRCCWRRRPPGTARPPRSQSARPASTPAPNGAYSLCPENATQSTSSSRDVHGAVRGELRRVQDDAGAVPVRGVGQLAVRATSRR